MNILNPLQKITDSKEVDPTHTKNPGKVGMIIDGVVIGLTCTVQYLTNTDHIDYVYHVQYIYVGLLYTTVVQCTYHTVCILQM